MSRHRFDGSVFAERLFGSDGLLKRMERPRDLDADICIGRRFLVAAHFFVGRLADCHDAGKYNLVDEFA